MKELKLTNTAGGSEFFRTILSKGLKLIWLEDLHRADQQVIAEKISAITASEATLLYQSPEEIMDKLVVAVVLDDDDIVSVCSVMEPGANPFGHTVVEMGGMWTRSDYRHLKLATHLAQLVELKAKQKGIDLLYAFGCKYSIKILARLGYAGEISVDELDWSKYPIDPDPEGNVNAADLIDQIAINFCRNVCLNPAALDAMRRLDLMSDPDFGKRSKSQQEAILSEFHKDIVCREEKFAQAIDSLIAQAEKIISEGGDEREIDVIELAINIYLANLNNNLRCCDLVAVKVLRT